MPLLSPQDVLFAQPTRWESLASGFKGRSIDSRDVVLILMALAAVALGVWLLSYLLAAIEKRQSYDGPKRLFFSLCRAHRLSWHDTWLLWRLARSQHLEDPARLFVEPERFRPAGLPTGLKMHAARLAELGDRVFARPEPGTAGQASLQGKQPAGPAPLLPPLEAPGLDVPPWPAGEPTFSPDAAPGQPAAPDSVLQILDLDAVRWHEAESAEPSLSGHQN